jgi:hypothetical protein
MEISGIIKSDMVDPASDAFWAAVDNIAGGKEQRTILILTNSFDKGSAEETRLSKMIDACKLTPDQYNLLGLGQDQKPGWHRLKEKLAPRIVFLIGILPAQLGVSALFRLNEPNNFDGCIWLPTLAVNDLEQNADVKKQLWINGMKPIFIDKVYQ